MFRHDIAHGHRRISTRPTNVTYQLGMECQGVAEAFLRRILDAAPTKGINYSAALMSDAAKCNRARARLFARNGGRRAGFFVAGGGRNVRL